MHKSVLEAKSFLRRSACGDCAGLPGRILFADELSILFTEIDTHIKLYSYALHVIEIYFS